MNRLTKHMVAFIIVAALLATGVTAFGVSPASKTIVYGVDEPTFTFKPVLKQGESGRITVRTEGELEQYLALSYGELTSEPIKGRITTLPDLPPGRHTQYVVVGLVTDTGGTVGSKTEIGAAVHIDIPYPAAYLDGDFELSQDESTGDMKIILMLQNLGTETVTPTAMEFSLEKDGQRGLDGRFVPQELKSGVYEKHQASFEEVPDGVHDTTVRVLYADREFLKTKELAVGKPVILINDFRYVSDEQGVIKPIIIDADIGWNREIPVKLEVFMDNRTTPEFSEIVTVQGAFEHIFYLDTGTTAEPESLLLKISAGGTVKFDEFTAKQPAPTVVWVLFLLLIIVLLVGGISLLLLLRRGKKGR